MAEFGAEGTEVRTRIVYWGIEGSGKSANVQVIHSKLRPDHRGDLRNVPTRLDPTVTYDALPIELGQIGGVRTRIQIIAVPGAPEHAPTRKQLLDQVDGIVFVLDAQRHRIDENLASLEELREALASYGRSLEEIPLVVQYNKRDQSDPFALEELHRKLGMRSVAAFEAVATNGTGVLQTLTTISKRVIRHLRERADDERAAAASIEAAAPPPEPAPPQTAPPPGVTQILEAVVSPAEEPVAPLMASAAAEEIAVPEAIASAEESSAIDPELLDPEEHPDAAAIEATTAQAEAVFDAPFRQATLEMAPPTRIDLETDVPATPAEFRIDFVGEPSRTETGAVRIPIVLRDDAGQSLAITLHVQIEAGKTE